MNSPQKTSMFVALVVLVLLATILAVGYKINWDTSYFSAELESATPESYLPDVSMNLSPKTSPESTAVYSGDYVIVQPDLDAHSPRPDACRTYWIGGFDATDGVSCEDNTALNTPAVIYYSTETRDKEDNSPNPTATLPTIAVTPSPTMTATVVVSSTPAPSETPENTPVPVEPTDTAEPTHSCPSQNCFWESFPVENTDEFTWEWVCVDW